MHHQLWLRGIPEIVFKLGMQCGACFAIMADIFFLQMTKYYFHLCAHATAKLRGYWQQNILT